MNHLLTRIPLVNRFARDFCFVCTKDDGMAPVRDADVGAD